MAVVEDFNVFQFQDFFLNAMAVDFLSCISDWNPTQHWLEMTMATIRSGQIYTLAQTQGKTSWLQWDSIF